MHEYPARRRDHDVGFRMSDDRCRMTDDALVGGPSVLSRLLSEIRHVPSSVHLSSVICHPSQRPVQHTGTKLDDGTT